MTLNVPFFYDSVSTEYIVFILESIFHVYSSHNLFWLHS